MKNSESSDGLLLREVEALRGRIATLEASDAELRRAEELLSQSEQRYRELLAAVTTYTYTVNVEQGVAVSTVHTAGCVHVTGYSPEDYAADRYLWIRMVYPDDRDMVLRHVERVLSGQSVPPIEHRVLHKDGTTRWVRDTIVPHYDVAGNLAGYDGLVADVTDRKRGEEQFRQLLESAPDAMIITDLDGRILLVNEQTEQLFGYPRAELVGQMVEILLPALSRDGHREVRVTCPLKAHPGPSLPGDLFCACKDGRKLPVDVSLRTVETDQGVLISSAVRDLSERRRTEQALHNREMQLLAAQRIQEHLLPKSPPELPGLDIAGASYAAEFAAGDLFDYLPMQDGCLAIVVGDVTGHGIGSALLMASTDAHLRSFVETHVKIEEILRHVNRVLAKEMDGDQFVTLLLARLDPRDRTLAYASAGHPTGYVLDSTGRVKASFPSTALPLGILPEAEFPAGGPVALNSGDVVLLLTDGLLERMSPAEEPFGVERTLRTAAALVDQCAAEILRNLVQAARQFGGDTPLEDDVTLVVVKVA